MAVKSVGFETTVRRVWSKHAYVDAIHLLVSYVCVTGSRSSALLNLSPVMNVTSFLSTMLDERGLVLHHAVAEFLN